MSRCIGRGYRKLKMFFVSARRWWGSPFRQRQANDIPLGCEAEKSGARAVKDTSQFGVGGGHHSASEAVYVLVDWVLFIPASPGSMGAYRTINNLLRLVALDIMSR
jgi:hypothetical protein